MDTVQGFVAAPLRTRRRSWLLVVLTAPVAFLASLFVLMAVVDLAQGPEQLAGPIGGGLIMLVVMLAALLGVRHGLAQVPAKPAPDFSGAQAAREAILASPTIDARAPRAQRINAAAGLMLEKRYAEAEAAYQVIAQTSPPDRADALAQIGVARFFLGQYADAIAFYEQALAAGADAGMMNDNIQEARQALGQRG
jgi:TolA-binding protein